MTTTRHCKRSLVNSLLDTSDRLQGTKWRLIPPLAASGQQQMAIDRWLFEQHLQGLAPAILRFYTWTPPAISLGYHQHRYPEDWHQLQWQGKRVEVVRRPTGGRAVLHQGDLTYAVITSGMRGNRMQVYQALCDFLIEGWRSLGVDLHYGEAGRGYIHNPNCFGSATAADLVLPTGTKLIGSAQLRRGAAVLQHGSIRLTTDAALFEQVFGTPLPGLDLPIAPSEPFIPTVIQALTGAAARSFNIQLVEQPLTVDELALIPPI